MAVQLVDSIFLGLADSKFWRQGVCFIVQEETSRLLRACSLVQTYCCSRASVIRERDIFFQDSKTESLEMSKDPGRVSII